ncbi:MAG: Na+/H+ antiporter subunit E [Calothrix sp. SM1_5_4]|nr:Na+/H+ antiporter subunit E [Calothrix sp. SM1_5_4]
MKVLLWIELLIYLAKEIVVAAIQVAGYALFKGRGVTPALVRFPLRVRTPGGIYLLSSLITLTPGTISVDIENGDLLVHVIHTETPDNVVESIRRGFEDRVLALMGEAR